MLAVLRNKSLLRTATRGMSTTTAVGGQKVWTPQECLEDHRDVLLQLPFIMGAYVGPNAIEPRLNESIMVAVNSANQCPYCTGLHGELARMAGHEVQQVSELLCAKSAEEARTVIDEPAITYARIFAENGGRGDDVAAAYTEIQQHYGENLAPSDAMTVLAGRSCRRRLR